MRWSLATVAALFAGAAQAQEPDPAHLSLVAGYKAAFTCSAYFNAGRSPEEIANDELGRIYPGYREAMAELPDAVIDKEAKRVSVHYHEGKPPRVAQWRALLGCAQWPTGAEEFAVPNARVKQPRDATRPLRENISDDETLRSIVANAFDKSTFGEGTETTAVVVMKDGEIIAEHYRDEFDKDTPQRTWSVAKSIAATIIGAAVQDGLIAVDEPAGLEAWSSPEDPRGAITIEHLLHMSSGLTSPHAGNRTDDVYFGGGRVVDHAITNRLMAEPGTRWRYANNDTMALIRALRERMNDGEAFLAYPFERVLLPLGMEHTFLETDWNGDFILSSQVWTTARDLARLGQLYLNDGVWDGKRILPENWTAYVTTPAPDQPQDRRDGENRPGYGAQWWLYGERHGLPDGSFAARGNRGQYLMIIPEHDVIIVRRGFDDGGGFDLAAFAADILEALEK